MRKIVFSLFSCFVLLSCADAAKQPEDVVVPGNVNTYILPLDNYSGEIYLEERQWREFTFSALLAPLSTSNEKKKYFDEASNIEIVKIENQISKELAKHGQDVVIKFSAGRANPGFQLTCSESFLNVPAGEDLSKLFYVYPFANCSYPDFSVVFSGVGETNKLTLFDFLSSGYMWSEPSGFGLFFAPVETPSPSLYPGEITFTLSLSITGLDSHGEEMTKEFKGTLETIPNLPGENMGGPL